jgi:hypothetical protein
MFIHKTVIELFYLYISFYVQNEELTYLLFTLEFFNRIVNYAYMKKQFEQPFLIIN